nr:MAG: putative capsid protein 2 [Picornavirales sp.]
MNPEPADLSAAAVPALPEDSLTDNTKSLITSDTDFISMVYRWQPMGYRIVINLPFVADDINPLFAIKVTPYLHPVIQFRGTTVVVTNGGLYSNIYPSPSTLSATSVGVTCTRYDVPPILSSVASAHRFWRGSMKYGLRCVSNFAAQGYVILTVAKGLVGSQIDTRTTSVATLRTQHRPIQGLDTSARRYMHNSYLKSDISFFRHNEVTVPFEYPVPFYDTYTALDEERAMGAQEIPEINCPDNFVVAYNRGGITGSTAGAQVVYELEYCPGDDLEFSQQLVYSRHHLEFNNFNVTNDLFSTLADPTLPFTYPAYT